MTIKKKDRKESAFKVSGSFFCVLFMGQIISDTMCSGYRSMINMKILIDKIKSVRNRFNLANA